MACLPKEHVPWHTLVGALWAAITCGFLYTFSTFSTALRDAMHLTEAQLSTVGTSQVVVGLGTFVTGVVVDKVGIAAALCGGALLNGGSWFLLGAIALWDWEVPAPAVVVAGLASLATFGGAFITASVFKVLTQNFLRQRSVVIGICKAWVGVASGLLTTIYLGFHPSDEADPERLKYLWYLSGSSLVLPVLTSPLLRLLDGARVRHIEVHGDGLCVAQVFRIPLLTALTLLLVGVTATAALASDALPADARYISSWVLLSICALPVVFLFGRGGSAASRPVRMQDDQDATADHASVAQHASPWECGPRELLRKPAAWALWFTIFSIQAGGFLLTTNLGQIVESRSGPKVGAATVVTIFSCSQSLGRLSGGMWFDMMVRQRIARPWGFVVLLLEMAIAQAMLCIPGRAPLYGGVALAGMAFGLTYPLMIVTIAELFGPRKIAPNYMIYDGSPGAASTLLIAKYLVGIVYERHTMPGESTCYGDSCFWLSHAVVCCLQVVASFGAIWLARSSIIVYEQSVWGAPVGAPAADDKTEAADRCEIAS
mmetsp:Transcript_21036/g.38396  ORF Transcript_21036/g.38396 Transcript_21036/m.38396 type:complete len:543 (-) Transcript_21036:29-1657(-)